MENINFHPMGYLLDEKEKHSISEAVYANDLSKKQYRDAAIWHVVSSYPGFMTVEYIGSIEETSFGMRAYVTAFSQDQQSGIILLNKSIKSRKEGEDVLNRAKKTILNPKEIKIIK